MDIKEVISWSVSVVAVVIAAFAAFYTRHSIHSQRMADRWVANHNLFFNVYCMLDTHPELLQLHGITPESLAQNGLSVAEFNYIHLHMEAGSAYYHVAGVKRAKLTEVRQHFLEEPKVRMVWKRYLRDAFFNTSHAYSIAVDAYIAQVEAEISDQTGRSS